VNLQPLLESLAPDARFEFPQDQAPIDESLAQSVIRFGDALARGDDAALRPLLDVSSRAVLERLLVTGGWYDATGSLEAVSVIELQDNDGGGSLSLALQEPGVAYILNWEALPAPDGNGYVFAGRESPAEERARAAEFAGGVPAVSDALLDSVPEDQLSAIAFSMAVAEELGSRFGTSLPPDAMLAVMAQQSGQSVEQIRSLLDQGREALARGVRPPAIMIKLLATQVEMASKAGGTPIGLDELFEVFAKILNTTADDVRSMYDSAPDLPDLPMFEVPGAAPTGG
jgi:hypothetical protein